MFPFSFYLGLSQSQHLQGLPLPLFALRNSLFSSPDNQQDATGYHLRESLAKELSNRKCEQLLTSFTFPLSSSSETLNVKKGRTSPLPTGSHSKGEVKVHYLLISNHQDDWSATVKIENYCLDITLKLYAYYVVLEMFP